MHCLNITSLGIHAISFQLLGSISQITLIIYLTISWWMAIRVATNLSLLKCTNIRVSACISFCVCEYFYRIYCRKWNFKSGYLLLITSSSSGWWGKDSCPRNKEWQLTIKRWYQLDTYTHSPEDEDTAHDTGPHGCCTWEQREQSGVWE